MAQHAVRLAKAGLHDGPAGDADLLDITGAAPPFCGCQALQPLPAVRVPQRGVVITAVVHEFHKLRPRHGLGVNFKRRHIDRVLGFFIVKGKATIATTSATRAAAHLPAGGRDQHRFAQRQRRRGKSGQKMLFQR